jgi:hypothetical protein
MSPARRPSVSPSSAVFRLLEVICKMDVADTDFGATAKKAAEEKKWMDL